MLKVECTLIRNLPRPGWLRVGHREEYHEYLTREQALRKQSEGWRVLVRVQHQFLAPAVVGPGLEYHRSAGPLTAVWFDDRPQMIASDWP